MQLFNPVTLCYCRQETMEGGKELRLLMCCGHVLMSALIHLDKTLRKHSSIICHLSWMSHHWYVHWYECCQIQKMSFSIISSDSVSLKFRVIFIPRFNHLTFCIGTTPCIEFFSIFLLFFVQNASLSFSMYITIMF